MRITSRLLCLFLSMPPSLLCTRFSITGHHSYHTLTMSVLGQNRKYSLRADDVRSTPESGLKSDIRPFPVRANNGLTRRSKIDAGQSVKWSDGLPLDRPRQH